MQTLPNSLRIGVLRGGTSSEYDLSLKSGAHVLKHLGYTHKPLDIFISRDGKWHMQGLERNPAKILEHVDVVWNVMHCDGIQNILEHHRIPYTGSDKIISAFAVNKIMAKEKAKTLNIKVPVYIVVSKQDSIPAKAKEIFTSIPQPVVVKSVQSGSYHLAKSFAEIISALEQILENSQAALAEEWISGREAACAVVDDFRNQDIYAAPVIGNFSMEEKKEIEQLAKLIHSSLNLRHYSESHFLITPRRGIYFLETNPNPPITPDSRLVTSLSSVGVSMPQFLHHVLSLAIA